MMRAVSAGVIGFVVAALTVVTGADRFLESGAGRQSADMVGSWAGYAQIAVNWTRARVLPVHLTVRSNSDVDGTVGDATLRGGRLEANRGAIGRALHVKTDWIIRGTLEGDILKAEGIRRDAVMIPVDFERGRFEGGVHTTGSHFGGKESMWLAAHGLVLERVQPR